ncbi:hypothetical protein D3875_03600 [Deinococcus cavernae]|uniref:Uncharacterized protein n=1 Tax=Deinococcus cavernae TaxID=2320857 RepID=A0A418VEV0_9DEIO|nr:hypothetical protein D3875_03600 [Deinococcus cavernae]
MIGFEADEIKSMEAAARDICGEHVAGELWPAFYLSNRNEFVEFYGKRSLTDAERDQLRRQYAAAPVRQQYTPKTPTDLMAQLHSLYYNCGGFQWFVQF